MIGIMKCIEWLLWGLFMGIGWAIGQNLLNFIGQFIHAAH